jgi:hypothetical protein
MDTINPPRSATQGVRSYDDDVVVTDTDLVKDQYDLLEPSSYAHELHTRAWRGLQALGFVDIPQTIIKYGAARVVLGLNWVEGNKQARNKGGLLRTLLKSGDSTPPPLLGNNPLSGKYRNLVNH